MSLIAELKRRKVFKIGAAYVVVAWLAIQVVSIGFPAFDAPPWVLRVFILVALLGFPLSVVMAWVFDVTPGGVKLDRGVGGGQRIYAIAVALVVIAFGWYFYGQPSFRKGDVGTPASLTTSDPNTIAVLPFDNMSGDPKQDYFSDGMTEELLNVLAKVPQLKVVARTSVFQFKGKGGDVREIGRKLGVSHLVEGSVRRDGDEVRITAQLVRVADGFHVWSETYDRKLEGVFALQDDIARHIGAALEQSLGVNAAVATRAAIDPLAYDEYLKGRALHRQRKHLAGAISHFKAALAKAPEFAAGWSSLSLAYEVSFWYPASRTAEYHTEMLDGARTSAARAQALEPDAAATEHALGNVARSQFKFALAEQHYLRAMQIDPGYSDVREDYSELLHEVGRVGDSMNAARQLVKLDPYFSVGWVRFWNAAMTLDSRPEVEQALAQIRAIAPGAFVGKFGAIDYALNYDRSEEARAALAEAQSHLPASESAFASILLPWALGDAGLDAGKVSAALRGGPPFEMPFYLVARRDIAAYNDYMSRSGAIIQATYFSNLISGRHGGGGAMLRDPRVKARLIEYGFVDYWRENGWPEDCRPLGDADLECGLGLNKAL